MRFPGKAPQSSRLQYEALTSLHVEPFHALATDEHIRRYLFDGRVLTLDATRDIATSSENAFRGGGAGLWLLGLRHRGGAESTFIGFCGFHVFPELDSRPELVFALLHAHTGSGYAFEAARACIEHVRDFSGVPIRATVDAPNEASIRLLERLCFRRSETRTGAFGELYEYLRP